LKPEVAIICDEFNKLMVKIMSGTACLLDDYVENANGNAHNIDILSVLLFGKTRASCLLVDVSREGGAVIIPGNLSIPSCVFNLVIMSPDDKHKILMIVKAEKRWIVENYSLGYSKFGIEFLDIDLSRLQQVETLTGICGSNRSTGFACHLMIT